MFHFIGRKPVWHQRVILISILPIYGTYRPEFHPSFRHTAGNCIQISLRLKDALATPLVDIISIVIGCLHEWHELLYTWPGKHCKNCVCVQTTIKILVAIATFCQSTDNFQTFALLASHHTSIMCLVCREHLQHWSKFCQKYLYLCTVFDNFQLICRLMC